MYPTFERKIRGLATSHPRPLITTTPSAPESLAEPHATIMSGFGGDWEEDGYRAV